LLTVEATLTCDPSPQEVRDARLAYVPPSIRNRSSLALLTFMASRFFMALLFHTRPPWPRQPRACVNGARDDIISLLGRSVTLVTFHSVDASDCCVPRGHGSGCGTFETCRGGLTMSVCRARPEVACPWSNGANDPNRTFGAGHVTAECQGRTGVSPRRGRGATAPSPPCRLLVVDPFGRRRCGDDAGSADRHPIGVPTSRQASAKGVICRSLLRCRCRFPPSAFGWPDRLVKAYPKAYQQG
jgi:hypothetical protein